MREWVVWEHRDHSGLEIGPLYEGPYACLKGTVEAKLTISGGRRNGVTDDQRAMAKMVADAVNQYRRS